MKIFAIGMLVFAFFGAVLEAGSALWWAIDIYIPTRILTIITSLITFTILLVIEFRKHKKSKEA